MIKKEIIDRFRVEPGSKVDVRDYPTDWLESEEARTLGGDLMKPRAHEILEKNRDRLARAQTLLYASDVYSVLIILQAMDAGGKDGTIRHVMSGVNPQGCQVFSFKQPSVEELDHDFLWRYSKRVPERGRIGIFNRSYYEEVLVVKVHPELLERQKLPSGKRGRKFWQHRYDDINGFERHLARNGIVILKFFLHISKGEQKRRFLERLDKPEKQWKFSPLDVAERAHWDEYMAAYSQAIEATSTRWAPWHVIPADRKYVSRALVADIVTSEIEGLDLRYPELTPERRAELEDARRRLESE